jgi:hypothetical protein
MLAGAAVVACGETEEVTSRNEVSTAEVTPSPNGDLTPPSATHVPSIAPTGTPPSSAWTNFREESLGLTIPYPPGLTQTEQTYDLFDTTGAIVGSTRSITLAAAGQDPALSIAISSNPGILKLEDWIRSFPGWPSEPIRRQIAGLDGLYFEVNQMGEKYPAVFFAVGGTIVSISGNVFGVGGGAPTITGIDFESVLNGTEVDQT